MPNSSINYACFQLFFRMLMLKRSSILTFRGVFRCAALGSWSVAQILHDKPFEKIVQVKGWVESVRRHKTVTFMQISDRSYLFDRLQVVITANSANNALNESQAHDINNGAFVHVVGRLVASKGQKQAVDLLAESVEVIGAADSKVYPSTSSHTLRDLTEMRKIPHLRPRSELFRAILSARSKAANIVHRYFEKNGFILTHPPILTQNRCEEGSEAFRVESAHVEQASKDSAGGFFDAPTFLTVSTQLHLEALCAGLGNVYTFGPTFRADHSLTRQHLAEFYMIEAEMPFIYDLNALCKVIETFVKAFVSCLHEKASREFDIIYGEGSTSIKKEIGDFVGQPFKKIPYMDACELLLGSKKIFAVPFHRGNDLTKEHELFLVEAVGGPVFLVNHPASLKPFYMRTTDDGTSALSVDLLLPNVAEVCGGSVREHELSKIEGRLTSQQRTMLDWYLDLRRVGTFPHSGFGIGFERLLQFSLGLRNIRDTIAFPRFIGSCKF